LNATRYAEYAVTRCPVDTKSANNALDAGRYNSPVNPVSAVNPRIAQKFCAPHKTIIAAATENMDSTIVFLRPIRSDK
jgi:hypothetical protein